MLRVPDGVTRDPNAMPLQPPSNVSSRGGGDTPPALPQPSPSGPGWRDAEVSHAFAFENRRGRDVLRAGTFRRNLPGGLRLARNSLNLDSGTGNGNYLLSVPILSLPGRGQNVSLTMYYNAQLWTKTDNQTIVYDHDHGWPAPGWSLGFGKVVRMGSSGVALEDADGTLHPFAGTVTTFPDGYTDFVSHTTDGTLIQCVFTVFTVPGPGGALQAELQKGNVQYPNGTTVQYGAPGDSGSAMYPTRITDSNGNYIGIEYFNNSGPRLSQIVDTLGRRIDFFWDRNGQLTSLTGPAPGGGRRQLVTLEYQQQTLQYQFAAPLKPIAPQTVSNIEAIYFPATQTGYWFGDPDSYSTFGMIAKVSQRRGMAFATGNVTNSGAVSYERTYNYPLHTGSPLSDAPAYTQMVATWAGMDSDPARTAYSVQTTSDSRQITTTYPDGTVFVQKLYNHPGQYDDGLLYEQTTSDGSGNMLRQIATNWEPGDYDSPRTTRSQITDELKQTTSTTFQYKSAAPARTNQLTDVTQFNYDGQPLYTTHTDYVADPAYSRISNIPSGVTILDGKGQIVSRTQFEYDADAEKASNTPGVANHDDALNPYASRYWVPPVDSLDCTDVAGKRPVCVKTHEPGYWASDYNSSLGGHRGNVTKITRYADAARTAGAVTQSFGYDITGNVISQRPGCCEVTLVTYDDTTQYAYPTKITRGSPEGSATAARNTTSAAYDLSTGLPKGITDANLVTTTLAYDPALRPATITLQAGATTNYVYDDAHMSFTTVVRDSANTTAAQSVTRLNGLGLVKQVETAATDGSWNASSNQFDTLGRVSRQSQPFRLGDQPLWNQFTYDALGRITTLQQADGSIVQRHYDEMSRPNTASGDPGQTTRIVDAAGRERWLRNDALGRLAEVVEPDAAGDGTLSWNNGANDVETSYQYDALERLVKSLQGQAGQERDFRYDSLGRMIAQRLPEKSATITDTGALDPSHGVWTDFYSYDERSNLESHTDARGVIVSYNYGNDPLDRLQGVSYTNSGGDSPIPSLSAAYSYVTTGDLTRPSQIELRSDPKALFSADAFQYDKLGRLAAKTTTFTGISPLEIDYRYDSLNRTTKETYPGASGRPTVVEYLYGLNNTLAGMKIDGMDQASSLRYSPAGQLTNIAVGAGPKQTIDSYTYDPATSLLKNDQVLRGSSSLMNLAFAYSPARQLTALTDADGDAESRSYTYDALGRLASVSAGIAQPLWTQTYDYDVYGNRSKCLERRQDGKPCSDKNVDQSGVPRDGLELKFDPASNHISSPGFAYDAAGNEVLSTRADQIALQYLYDSAGRLARVTQRDGTVLESNTYAPDGRRLLHFEGDNATYYLWDGQHVVAEFGTPGSPHWQKSRFYLGDRLLSTMALPTAGNVATSYFHPDQLGTRLITNSADASATRQTIMPFGTLVPTKSPNPLNPVFTTYDRSAATGLDYALNRHYESATRFVEPDPAGIYAASLSNPQSLNLYGYVGNDPVNRIDSAGLVPDGPVGIPWTSQDYKATGSAALWGAAGSLGGPASALAGAMAGYLNQRYNDAVDSINGSPGPLPAGNLTPSPAGWIWVPSSAAQTTITSETFTISPGTLIINNTFESSGGPTTYVTVLTAMNSSGPYSPQQTVIQATNSSDGSSVVVITAPDGTTTTNVTAANGTQTSTVQDANGNTVSSTTTDVNGNPVSGTSATGNSSADGGTGGGTCNSKAGTCSEQPQ